MRTDRYSDEEKAEAIRKYKEQLLEKKRAEIAEQKRNASTQPMPAQMQEQVVQPQTETTNIEQEVQSFDNIENKPKGKKKGLFKKNGSKNKSGVKKKVKKTTAMQELGYLLIKIGIIAAITVILFTFVFGITRVKSPSMSPAINDGDIVIYYRLEKRYVASDLCIVDYKNEKQVRRVIAIEGDEVSIVKDGVMINGALQQEEHIYSNTTQFEGGIDFPVTLKKNQVFVLGDNREVSNDSRLYGPVDKNATKGKVMMIIRRRGL